MNLATFRIAGERRVGVVDTAAGTVTPYQLPPEDAERGVLALVERAARGDTAPPLHTPMFLAEVTLEAPFPRPRRNLFCVGKNYHDHAHEFSSSGYDSSAAQGAVPAHPIIFSKVPETVIGPGEPIVFDRAVTEEVDYEVELAVIIGRAGRRIARDRALEHVWGYTIVNDVTARDLQRRYSQWLIGKSQDGFCPMGPVAVTAEAIDLDRTGVRTFVNGEPRQDSHTGLLIFDVPTLIATLSEGVTLLPGDIIATGTPAGVGLGFDPPRFLGHGDTVRVEIDGIGSLENPVVERGR